MGQSLSVFDSQKYEFLIHVPQRIEPIGYDNKRNAYWLIGGTLPNS